MSICIWIVDLLLLCFVWVPYPQVELYCMAIGRGGRVVGVERVLVWCGMDVMPGILEMKEPTYYLGDSVDGWKGVGRTMEYGVV
ncbi:hypothetical protein SERLA73DRAFT_189457 [Serpula lacrymans var. lacrymans S7.3]|uniref:Secreted protein n=2 Tax=Serpula lacrymans var. lacrymans TaxID=341189 RepID=F8QDP7_SERL3|nr:uncharacterized protein SERLADRAFT_480279 [Serpula lacrymans var. lacrymans S7.9]EGN93718.1 hypothetical protein SERLA73DRAFT_189457 [Serpula lacrymans var. lacrymans S7.3]EGO19089.1 hypothetical protein SERLADRAFT_480279 [Serpula lacrymans var. lacrymans S7.9]